MHDNSRDIDFEFIQKKIDAKARVEIFLVNGVKLSCTIFKQDENSIITSSRNDDKEQLVFKSNISTIT